MIDLSIIVVNWNTCDYLRTCLNSIYSTVNGLEFETWVVDNGSIDDSVAMVKQSFNQVKLIENSENVGFSRANNQALHVCHGKYVLLLNSDAFLTPEAAFTLRQVMEIDPNIGIAGPRLVYPDGRNQKSYGDLPSIIGEITSLLGLDRYKLPAWVNSRKSSIITGQVSGACMLVQKAMVDEIGMLDERFFMFSEEIDLCKRAELADWKVVYVPASLVIHVGGGSSGLTADRIINLYKSKIKYFDKHHGPGTIKTLRRIMLFSSWMKSLLYRFWDMKRAVLWQEVSMAFRNTQGGKTTG